MLEAIKMYFLPSIVLYFALITISCHLLNKQLLTKTLGFYIAFILFFIFTSLNSLYIDKYVRLITMTILVFIINFIIFKETVRIILVLSFFEQILVCISEITFSIVFSIFMNFEIMKLSNNYFNIYLCNIFVSLMLLFLIRLNFFYNIYKMLINITKKIQINVLLKYIIIFITSTNILTFLVYFESNIIKLLIANVMFLIMYMFIILAIFNEKNKNIKFKEENELLLSSLNEYEKMLDYQRVNNHENKNQLLVIKSMIEKNNDNIVEYIEEIIKEKREDNEIIYNKAKRIPSGGLQGLIYQKMLLMQERNIEVDLDINSEVRKIDFCNLSSKMNYDICRIVGIILDNAIEETTKFNKKEREIIISMYVDKLFVIEISNRIKDNVDLSKIYDKGFTSKTNGHGYGLSLLKKIVDENENIINEVKIINNIFIQIIKIKM